jgi:hypothetical protein
LIRDGLKAAAQDYPQQELEAIRTSYSRTCKLS